MTSSRISLIIACALAALAGPANAQTQAYVIDATSQPSPPETSFLKLGSHRSPSGHTIAANSRYLLRDGRPWLPVMGEFHYSRYPVAEWEQELLKMKAGGVQIIASYVIWIHHEEEKGIFDWSGQRDLRRFVELAAKHGLYAYPRIGPWSHAEVRSGGFPDWLVREAGSNLRSNDSTYLRYVDRFYGEIAQQLRGLLWKEGGPIIGIQLENEYNQRGPNRGEDHILTLKRLALKHGFDVPLYTVTGWDNTVVPPAEVIPVFGGYPDMPWDQSNEELPPGEVYRFRFDNRWAGNLPARTEAGELHSTSQAALARYPFLGAEYGGGIQITYHRRPVISADDIAAMLPVQIGSGVNLYGYYMFHGGTNPEGKLTTLQESQRTGYPTDVPVKSYDFQTLLSEFGELRTSFKRAKLMHYFLNEFGDLLAPMVVRAPDRVPASVADTSMLRLSARTLGKHGFIFGNNYLRNYRMPDRKGVQVTLRLPGETLRVPAQAIDVPSGAYFVWPANLEMNGALLKYSTAQLMTRAADKRANTWYFFAPEGIAPEFSFDAGTVAAIDAQLGRAGAGDAFIGVRPAQVTRADGRVRVRFANERGRIDLRSATGAQIRIELLTRGQAENLWRGPIQGSGARPADSAFAYFAAARSWPPVPVSFQKMRDADAIGPVPLFNAVPWRKVEIALAPSDSAWAGAARYRLAVPAAALDSVSDVLLEIRYVGDVARLYAGDRLLNDNFYNGTPWRISAWRYREEILRGELELRILPLRGDAPIYIPGGVLGFAGQRAELTSITATRVQEPVLR